MGRDSDKRKGKRRHSHHSRHDDSDSEDDDSSMSSSDYDSDTSDFSDSSDTSTSEEERRRARKKARRAREAEKRHSKTKLKLKRRTSIKGREKKAKRVHKADIVEISMDDYFLKSAEFRMWLSKERGVFFSDLSSEESRKLFKKFAGKWNSGVLDKSYYKGIQSSAVGHSAQSNYQWQLSSNVNSSDLKAVRDDVSAWSRSKDNFDFGSSSASAPSAGSRTSHPSIGPQPSTSEESRVIGPSRGPKYGAGGDSFEREEKREAEKAHTKRERKELRKQQELALDEMLPKATGREARVEKKKIRAEKRKEREYSPDFGESKVYGTSNDSIRDKVKARQVQRESKAQAAVQKISDYKAKEKAKMEAILQMARANKKDGAMW